MSRRCRWLPVAILFALVAPVRADERPKPVKLERTWGGEIALKLKAQAPRAGYIADAESWKNLWAAYRGAEKVPEVDFDKELVLVAVNDDPNRIGINATLDAKGDVQVSIISTLIAFKNPTTCTYQFAVVKRDGIKSVGGNALVKPAGPVKEVPKEVRALEGTYTGAWTMSGVNDKGEVVKKMSWTDTVKVGSAEVKGDRAFVTTVDEMTFDGVKAPPTKLEGKEGYYLNKDGSLGDAFVEFFGRVTRMSKLGDGIWTYTNPAAEQELTRLGFPKGASGSHVIVKVVTKEQGVETHRISRVTTVTWKDGGKEQTLQFVSLQGHHKRQP